MRGSHRTRLIAVPVALLLVGACGGRDAVPVPGVDGAVKSSADVRAERRAYDGAPPTVPHDAFGSCTACHNAEGQAVDGLGFAPASPHGDGPEAGGTTRCNQCHVYVTTDDEFVESEFVALRQDLAPGGRATSGAPPTIPHRLLMRENCAACHTGPAAREEIRTSHPERVRCRQCHVPVSTHDTFESGSTVPMDG